MSSANPSAIVCTGLRFAWPDGAVVFDQLDLAVGPGRTGLIGRNGSGKSTLLRLVADELTPAAGSVSVAGELAYLRQDVPLATDRRVDQVLGTAPIRAAIAAIESGDASEHHFAVVGDNWDIDERTAATLHQLGLDHLDPDRPVGEVSGGESVLLAVAAQLLLRPDVLLLDEPTNNLDRRARQLVYDVVAAWPGVLVIVTHDRELLERVDRIAELRDGSVTWYGGNFTAYQQAVAAEQEAAQRMVRVAESDVRRQQRELIEARTKLDRRRRYAQKMWDNKREPRAVMRMRKRTAQVSAGKHRNLHLEKLAEANDRLRLAEEAVRDDDEIRVELPRTSVPAGRDVLRLAGVRLRCGPTVDLDVRGPERVALVGPNGAGKTTLVETIAGRVAPLAGDVRVAVPHRLLPQRLDVLDDRLSAAGNVAAAAPAASDNTIRAQLARFLFSGDRADRPAGTLSGGERFRASLATLLLAEPAPQLFLLDEPTNNLDLASVEQLSQALDAYAGALLVASHDLAFLRGIGVTRWLRLDGDGELAEVDPL